MLVAKRTTSALLAGIVLVLLGSACERFLAPRPEAVALVGTYVLSPKSVEWLRHKDRYQTVPESRIELRADGGITIQNLPDCAVNGFGKASGRFLSGSGTWKIEELFLGYGLSIVVRRSSSAESAGEGNLRPGVYGGAWIQVQNAGPPYELEVTIGDPDSGEALIYVRRD